MLQKPFTLVSSKKLEVSLFRILTIKGTTPAPLPNLWPLPQQLSLGNTTIVLGTPFTFEPSISSDILNKAIQRYSDIIFTQGNNSLPGNIRTRIL